MRWAEMSPNDGWVAAPEHTWTLAGGKAEPVLFYSPSGPDITFTRTLFAARYAAIWFDPRIGSAQPAQHISAAASTVLKKPDTNDWLLVLTPE